MAKIKAVAASQYVLAKSDTFVGPEKITLKRVGKNLVLSVSPGEEGRVIIEDYYAHPGDVLGVDAEGNYHEYVKSADGHVEADALTDGESSLMILEPDVSHRPISTLLPDTASNGFLKAAGVFAGLLALGGIISTFHHHHSGSESPLLAPHVDSASDVTGDITGMFGSGGTINDAEPLLQGTGQTAGHMINIYDNGVLIGQTVVNADGSWAFTPPELAHGLHSFTTVETDGQRFSQPSAGFELNVDLLPPEVSLDTLTDSVGTLTGDIVSGGLTNDNQPQLQGQSEPGARIDVFVDGVKVGETTTGGDGKWSLTLSSPLTDGEHSITVTATDAVGNTSAPSAGYVIHVDTMIAQPLIDHITDTAGKLPQDGSGLTNDNRPTLRGMAEAGSTVTVYIDGVAAGSTTADAQGVWTFISPELADGQRTLSVVAIDAADNISAPSQAWQIIVDTVAEAPVITQVTDDAGTLTGNIPDHGLTNDVRPTLEGTAEAGNTVTLYLDGKIIGSVVADDTGAWTFTPTADLPEGANAFSATATDAAGNTGAKGAAWSVIIDATPPDAPVITHAVDNEGTKTGDVANGGSTDDSTPELRGTAEPGSTVYVEYNDGSGWVVSAITATVDASGNWSWTSPELNSNTVWEFHAKAVDPAGNISPYSDTFSLTPKGETHLEDFEMQAGGVNITAGHTFLSGLHVSGVSNKSTNIGDVGVYGHGKGFQLGWVEGAGQAFNLKFDLPKPANQLSFELGAADGIITVDIFNTAGETIYSTNIVGGGTSKNLFDYTSPTDQNIAGFRLITTSESNGMSIDTIAWNDKIGASNEAIDNNQPDNITFNDGAAHNDIFSIADSDAFTHDNTVFTGSEAISTLTLTGESQTLQLGDISNKLESIEVIDITGSGDNTLNISIDDILLHGEKNLFIDDGKNQLMIKGNEGDVVNLDDLISGSDVSDWRASGEVTVGGAAYQVYRHDDADTELLVQQGVQINLI